MGIRGAIIVGGYVNGLGLVRALAARDVPTAVVTTKPYDIAQYSRWISSSGTALDIEERPEQLVELLERRAREWSGWALFPTNDGALAALARHRDRLSSTYRVVAPPMEVARYFLDKHLMLDEARAVGVDTPHCYGRAVDATAHALGSALSGRRQTERRIPFLLPLRMQAVRRARSRRAAALHRAARRRADARARSSICIPGPDSQIYAYCTYIDAQRRATRWSHGAQAPPEPAILRRRARCRDRRGQSGAARGDDRDRSDASAFAAWR